MPTLRFFDSYPNVLAHRAPDSGEAETLGLGCGNHDGWQQSGQGFGAVPCSATECGLAL